MWCPREHQQPESDHHGFFAAEYHACFAAHKPMCHQELEAALPIALSESCALCEDSDSDAVDVLSPISILSDAWRALTQDTIRIGFRHAGFVVVSEDQDSHIIENPTAEMPPAAAFDISDMGAATFEDFTNIDNAVLPCAELDDDEIVRQILEPAATRMMTCHQR
ncbi:hypothetical protein HPB48_000245 [Haemaphysalis longicornis]|uniref:Uncharacterized protein n=1 Tax=Haemaphysalis longicornis TaxID=44386 RepID=A0A9J6FAF4_HAELO|nr:hypothetical protein HPB48_000245 [Haemaphysalis longicornis]